MYRFYLSYSFAWFGCTSFKNGFVLVDGTLSSRGQCCITFQQPRQRLHEHLQRTESSIISLSFGLSGQDFNHLYQQCLSHEVPLL